MALPTPLEILLQDQVKLVIKDAAAVSRKQVDYYDGSTYRNTFPNHKLDVKPNNVTAFATFTTDTANLQVLGSPGAATLVNNAAGALASRVYLDDVASAVEPHIWKKIRTRVEFWSGVIGNALPTLSVTTTSGSATLTVSDNSLLTPGQAISGTGIPTGAVIMFVPFATRTSVILTHQATASATVTATLTGSNYLGGYWEDEELGNASEIAILQ